MWAVQHSFGYLMTNGMGIAKRLPHLTQAPSYAHMIRENLAIGTQLGFRQVTTTSGNDFSSSENRSQSWGVSLFAERFFPISSSFTFGFNGNTEFSRGFDEQTFGGTANRTKYNAVRIGAHPFLAYLPSEKWMVRLSLAHISFQYRRGLSNEDERSTLDLGAGNIGLGINYFFRPK